MRDRSIDCFRGLIIMLMVLVNSPGRISATYPWLQHADWHGSRVADLIFPAFLFIVGLSLHHSTAKQIQRGLSKQEILIKGCFRAVILFGLGLLVENFPLIHLGLEKVRILGVLQRIGICYLLALVVGLYSKNGKQIAHVICGLLAAYLLIIHQVEDAFSLSGNVIRQIDLVVIGASHMGIKQGLPFEWYGLVSSLTSLVTVLSGLLVARTEFSRHRLVLIGILAVCLGYGLHYAEVIPINQQLWTPSFVLISLGSSIFAWQACKLIVFGRFSDFAVRFGKNSLLCYAVSRLLYRTAVFIPFRDANLWSEIYDYLLSLLAVSQSNAALIQAVLMLLLISAMAIVLDRKSIYVKI